MLTCERSTSAASARGVAVPVLQEMSMKTHPALAHTSTSERLRADVTTEHSDMRTV
jgi:hypothetical protein